MLFLCTLDVCKHCNKAFTVNNIKKHEEKCAKNKEGGTYEFKIDFSGGNKELIKKIFEDLEPERYLIAEERGMGTFVHMHCYLKSKTRWLLENLQQVIRTHLEPDHESHKIYLMNVETCRSAKKWVKYITKEDTEPIMMDVDQDWVHDNLSMYQYITTHRTINPFDNGVKKHQTSFKKRRLEEWHSAYWETKMKKMRSDSDVSKSIKHDEWLNKIKNSTKKGVYI